jgi:hypothetical protein
MGMQDVPRETPATVSSELEGESFRGSAGDASIQRGGLGEGPPPLSDLRGIIGTWQEDPELDEAITGGSAGRRPPLRRAC